MNQRAHPLMLLGIVLTALVCFGCVSQPVPPTTWRTTLVTATGSNVPGNIQGIGNRFTRFTFNGKIHAHATLVADDPVTPSTSTYTMKWFNETRLAHQRSAEYTVSMSPYYLVHAAPGSVLGPGSCHVELHSANGLLATREFLVVER
ncbi:MAG: hypothetical protein K9K30_03160 [Burkholderiaceae bacterium]|nr:hypothetical protein [Burkholderiaceae bacterium]MCF8184171.1 hypothetical protein [Polynucleobacter sp.]